MGEKLNTIAIFLKYKLKVLANVNKIVPHEKKQQLNEPEVFTLTISIQ